MSKNTGKTPSVSKGISKTAIPKHLEQINLWAAGIDIGATSHFVAVPDGCSETTVREFKTFTSDLYALADWLKQCGIQTIAMESTGVYWIPVYEILEEKGFETGVDLLAIPGINNVTAMQLIGEIGLDMTRWRDDKQFASWLGLCPGNKVSGGKRLSGKTKQSNNRAAATLRLAASTLYRSPTALGAYLRRLKSRKGPMKAITATAHKLAKIIYNMLRYGVAYMEIGQAYYEEQYRERKIRNMKRMAAELGYSLVETSHIMTNKPVL